MAFDISKLEPLVQGGDGFTIWRYASSDALVSDADGYFKQKHTHGPFKLGDLILQVDDDASPVAGKLLMVSAINAVTKAVTVTLLNTTALT